MFDTISVGSATLDIFFKSKQFDLQEEYRDGSPALSLPYGKKIDVDDFELQSGGGGTNTAVALARLGLRAAVVTEVGQDLPAQVIQQELTAEGVDLTLLIQEKSEKTAISALLIGSDGDRAAVTGRGAARLLTVDDLPFDRLAAHWIHVSSLGNLETTQALARHCNRQRIRFSWNPGSAELQAFEEGRWHPTEIYPTVFIVNEEEAARLSGAGYDLETVGSIVVVTDGARGGRFYERGRWESFTALEAPVVQMTGAGDAFASGLVAAYLHDRLTLEAVEWGKRNAASVIQYMGAKTGLLRKLEG